MAMLTDLPAPAVAENSPLLDVRIFLLDFFHETIQSINILVSDSCGLEEVAKLLAFLVGIGWEPRNICEIAFKEIWHEYLEFPLALLMVETGQDVSTLKCLWKEAEDVVDDENA